MCCSSHPFTHGYSEAARSGKLSKVTHTTFTSIVYLFLLHSCGRARFERKHFSLRSCRLWCCPDHSQTFSLGDCPSPLVKVEDPESFCLHGLYTPVCTILLLVEVCLIYSLMLASGVQQSDSVIHARVFSLRFFSFRVYYKMLNIVPWAVSRSLLFICFTHVSMYLLIPDF